MRITYIDNTQKVPTEWIYFIIRNIYLDQLILTQNSVILLIQYLTLL